MSKRGTLILYDSENMKVPLIQKNQFIISRINMEYFTDRLRSFFEDTHHNFISFNKRYYGKDNKRNEPIDRHKDDLEAIGYTVVEKTASIKSNVVTQNGKKLVYEYEECDMDGEIIHTIHSLGSKYARIVLVSGDKDMKTSLDYMHDTYGIEIWIVSHKEKLSSKYDENNVLELQVLMRDTET